MTKMLLLIGIWALLTVSASGATLYGKVIEINDGDTITILNLNRPLKVQILGVDAPTQEQPYADVARKHLSDLILYKQIAVESSGLVQNSYILGKVFYRDMDVGAQLLRDGVAWFDKSASSRLTDSERKIYSECEVAARSEHRGLWQDTTPVRPWEFRQQQAERSAASQSAPSLRTIGTAKRASVLGSEDLLRGIMGSNSVSRLSSSTTATGENQWRTFAPEGKHFSLQVPGPGYESSATMPAGDTVANVNYWTAEYEGATYILMWSQGPNLKYTDASAIDDMAKGLVSGLNRGFEKRGLGLVFDAKLQRPLKLNGYTGSEFAISAANVPGVVRAFSKQFGDMREMYIVGVLNATEKNESVQKFLDSLSFTRNQ